MVDLEDAEQRKKRKLRAAKQPTQVRTNENSDNDSDDADEDEGEVGEGFRTLSWIWMGADHTTLGTDKILHAGELFACNYPSASILRSI